MNSDESVVLESIPLSVADDYFLTRAKWRSASEGFKKRNEFVPPKLNSIGLWDLAYIRPIISREG